MRQRLAFLVLSASVAAFAQSADSTLAEMEERLADFQYENVIAIANEALTARGSEWSEKEIAEARMLKSLSYFNLFDTTAAGVEIFEILRFDADYRIDESLYPPKFVAFFESMKGRFARREFDEPSDTTSARGGDTTAVSTDPDATTFDERLFAEALERARREGARSGSEAALMSILAPGLGRVAEGDPYIGYAFLAAAAASLGASIYAVVETQSRRDAYLGGVGAEEIAAAYDDYNEMYQFRNVALAALAGVWLAAQIDFFVLMESAPAAPESDALSYRFSVSIPF
jgi:hypothetical protein